MKKTTISAIVCLEIIDLSKRSESEQTTIKAQFNKLVELATVDIPKNGCEVVHTEAGAVITCIGEQENTLEDALFIALTIRDEAINENENNDTPIYMHIGINLGAASVDENRHVVGNGLVEVQQIKSFGKPNQILVSRAYYDMASKLTLEVAHMFEKYDMHAYEDDIYAVRLLSSRAADADERVAESTQTVAASVADDEAVEAAQKSASIDWRVYLLPFLLALIMLFVLIKWMQHDKSMSEDMMPDTQAQDLTEIIGNSEPLPEITSFPEGEANQTAAEDQSTGAAEKRQAKQPVKQLGEKDSKPKNDAPAAQVADEQVVQTPVKVNERSDKSTWDTIKESVTSGEGKRKCTQGEIALNQCQ